jgi:hypothetical protein
VTCPAPAQPTESVEDEVLGNLRRLPIGDHVLADLDLPEAFLRRIVDRVIRESYQHRFHVVYRDAAAPPWPPSRPDPPVRERPEVAGAVAVVRAATPADVLAWRRSLPEERPPLRGFRAPRAGADTDTRWPFEPPASGAERDAAGIVARRLASDGLLVTVARVLARFDDRAAVAPAEMTGRLRRCGVPVDLLACFRGPDGGDVVSFIVRRLAAGATTETLRPDLAALPFRFAPSRRDFRATTESGEHDVGLVRLQLTRGTYWRGVGTGGSIDLARQLVAALPDASFLVSIEDRFLDPFLAIANAWPLARPGRLTVVAEPLVVAQWAQDNGKAGTVRGRGGRVPATLVPRYASRREDGSVLVPGETFAADGLAAAGHVVIPSPLLFQGGNMLVVRDPANGRRVLLLGEAEVHRNTALGLTRGQAIEAFRRELAVDACVVLDSVSFHIDYDLTVRAHDGGLVTFVNDRATAARIIIECGVDALARHGLMEAETAAEAKHRLAAGDVSGLLDLVAHVVYGPRGANGFPLSLAVAFAADPTDSGVGNLQRFLVALDVLVATTLSLDQQPSGHNVSAYLRALRRAADAEQALAARLAGLGWRVVRVPGLAEADRGAIAVNGIHDRTRYLMPSYGGLYAPLDEAARAVIAGALGPEIAIVPIGCAESQRRVGAVHCSVAVYPGGPG